MNVRCCLGSKIFPDFKWELCPSMPPIPFQCGFLVQIVLYFLYVFNGIEVQGARDFRRP